jgi:hypothetical protein
VGRVARLMAGSESDSRPPALGLLLLPMVFPSRLRPESGSGWTGESCQQVTLNLSLPVMEP